MTATLTDISIKTWMGASNEALVSAWLTKAGREGWAGRFYVRTRFDNAIPVLALIWGGDSDDGSDDNLYVLAIKDGMVRLGRICFN